MDVQSQIVLFRCIPCSYVDPIEYKLEDIDKKLKKPKKICLMCDEYMQPWVATKTVYVPEPKEVSELKQDYIGGVELYIGLEYFIEEILKAKKIYQNHGIY